MRYLGGKSKNAKEIAAIVNASRGPGASFWEPFCGGLSVSVQLAKHGPGVVSDGFLPLVSLYRAVRDGWEPPGVVSREEHAAARLLPDTDPRKAFIGFGCSFGGKWFDVYAKNDPKNSDDFARASGNAVKRDVKAIARCALEHLDFLDVTPEPLPIVIYADPPYAGTEPYRGTKPFDSDRFWALVQGWERVDVPVFVSEYACPVAHLVFWEKAHTLQLSGGQKKGARLEKLFRVIV